MVRSWVSGGSPLKITWDSHGLSCVSRGSHGSPVGFHDLPWVSVGSHGFPTGFHGSLVASHGASMGFPWVSHGSPMDLAWASHGFPWVSGGSPMGIHGSPVIVHGFAKGLLRISMG